MIAFLAFIAIQRISNVDLVPNTFYFNFSKDDTWIIKSQIRNTVYWVISNYSGKESFKFIDGSKTMIYLNSNLNRRLFFSKESTSSLELYNLVAGFHKVIAIGIDDSCPNGAYLTNLLLNDRSEAIINCPVSGKFCLFIAESPFQYIEFTFEGGLSSIHIFEKINKTLALPPSQTYEYKITYMKDDYNNPLMIYLNYNTSQRSQIRFKPYIGDNLQEAYFHSGQGILNSASLPISSPTSSPTDKIGSKQTLFNVVPPSIIACLIIICTVYIICYNRKFKKKQVDSYSKSSLSSSSNSDKHIQSYNEDDEFNNHYNYYEQNSHQYNMQMQQLYHVGQYPNQLPFDPNDDVYHPTLYPPPPI